MRRRYRGGALMALGALLGTGACEFDAGLAPAIQPRLVVTAVLNPWAAEQIILVEETRAKGPGASSLPAQAYSADSLDPILARGGVPVSGAEVVLFDAAGDSAVAVEDAAARPDRKGAGVYRVRNWALGGGPGPSALRIFTARSYRLRVRAPLGTATGETRVPNVAGLRPDSCTSRVDRWSGGIGFNVQPVPAGSVYLTHVEGHFGPTAYFTSTAPIVRIGEDGERVFVGAPTHQGSFALRPIAWVLPPGFRQTIAAAAVDSNYYNYYRERFEDPFGSESRASSIRGGVGLFGSAVLLGARTVEVFSSANEVIAGRWAIDLPREALPDTLDLYVTSPWPFDRGSRPVAFTGRYRTVGDAGVVEGGVTGAVSGTSLALTMHDGRSAGSLERRIGAFGNATFDGTFIRADAGDGGPQAVYRRVRATPTRPPAGSCPGAG